MVVSTDKGEITDIHTKYMLKIWKKSSNNKKHSKSEEKYISEQEDQGHRHIN